MKTTFFIASMRIFVCFLNLCPFYVINYEMLEHMENKTDIYVYKFIFNFFIFASLTSYWIASLKKPKKIP